MIPENLTREELISKIKDRMVQMTADHGDLKAGEWYVVDQDEHYVTVYGDGWSPVYTFTYKQAKQLLRAHCPVREAEEREARDSQMS